MTIQEIITQYGIKVMEPSLGSNINKLMQQLYGYRSDKAAYILTQLNSRQDWDSFTSTDQINYLPEETINYVDEITS